MKICNALAAVGAAAALTVGMGSGLAQAQSGTAEYSVTDETNGATVKSAEQATEGPQEAAPEQRSLNCWNAVLSGSKFAISCNGSSWRAWVDCSNGYRYTTSPLSGSYRVAITCPGGSKAQRGGAYGH